MTVKELIEEIEDVPENIPVCIDGQDGLYDVISILWQVESGRIVRVVLQ